MSQRGVLEQRPDLLLEERAHRVRVAQLGAEILGEDLRVPRLVHGLGRGVVLGVDPRHGLDDLGRGHHGALLAVHELREARLEELDPELRVLLLGPRRHGRAGQRAGHPGHGQQRAVLLGHQPLGVDVDGPVEVRHAVPLRPHGLVVERDELPAVALVVPQEEPVRVVVDDLDGRLHVLPARYRRGDLAVRTPEASQRSWSEATSAARPCWRSGRPWPPGRARSCRARPGPSGRPCRRPGPPPSPRPR